MPNMKLINIVTGIITIPYFAGKRFDLYPGDSLLAIKMFPIKKIPKKKAIAKNNRVLACSMVVYTSP